MRNIALVTRRELGAYFRSPMGYVIVALVLFVDGVMYNYWALGGTAKYSAQVLEGFFQIATFMTMVSGILISMRLFAEERQLGTLTLLLTSPIRDHEIVLGKFCSALIFFSIMTVLTLYMPALIFVNGKVSIGHIAGGYFGLVLLGGLSLAVGLFASALSRSQIIAAVAGGALMTTIYVFYLGSDIAEPPLREMLSYISPRRHLQWHRGVLNSRDLFYYLSSTYLFLLLTTHVLKARRWR